jgi:hypothetical protein
MILFDSVRLKNELIALYFSSEFEMKPLYELVPHVNANNICFIFSNIYKPASVNMTIP